MNKTTTRIAPDEDPRTKSAAGLLPLMARNKRRAPISILSPAKRTALIECFNSNGLQRQKGSWRGSSDDKPASGGTVADLGRDGMLTLTINRRVGSAQLTERGAWFARTLIEALARKEQRRRQRSAGAEKMIE